ncbi:hypothetical protein GCM10010329_66850 [Streptomyces spiroverticillatus]|uniref:Lipoprotein n=1 Tax=Streptomyces finlayi TaxID=67296 RepID=A0A918X4W0_9ACTN|nr:hypothetical protein [Streptomyces finlayi]GHA34291.1 hypothetical protein GCM10010329_66850 [Streptomyces spiroverticillatus]GHD11867.1 hypothetical protein GCM10010334_68400 [Streptomyces finlayi]
MTFPRTNSRTAAKLRLASLVAAPVLALSVACGGAADAPKKDEAIADVPAAPSASETKGESSPSAKPAAKSAFYDAQMKYIQCMRAKGGYPDFPDPHLDGYMDWDKVNAIGAQPGRNDGIKGGKNRACVKELQDAMTAEPKRDQQKDYESMLAHAKCMRDNGVSRFANPQMSGGNAQPGGEPNPASPVLDEKSPAYTKARKTCAPKLLPGLDGMQ